MQLKGKRRGAGNISATALGDEVLKIVAQRIGRCVRATDTVARRGGDEFVVLLEGDVEVDTAARVSERIRAAMTEPFSFASGMQRAEVSVDGEAKLGVSIGIATHPPLESHADSLFKRADAAMYMAKRVGKGRAHVAVLELSERGERDGHLVAHAQPGRATTLSEKRR